MAAARGWPGCVSMTTCSAGDPPEVDAFSAGWTGGCPKPAPGNLPRRPEAPAHPQTPEAPPSFWPSGCCLGRGSAGAPRLPAGPAGSGLLGALGLCQHASPSGGSGGSAAQLGVWPAAGTRTLSHLAPAPPRTRASMAVSRPVACASCPGPDCPQPLPHLGSGPRGPVPLAGRRVRSLAVIARSWGMGSSSPAGRGQRGSKLCSWRAARGANAASRGGGVLSHLGRPSRTGRGGRGAGGEPGSPSRRGPQPSCPTSAAVWAASRPPGPRGPRWESGVPPGCGGTGSLWVGVQRVQHTPPSPALVSAHHSWCTHTHTHTYAHTLTRSHVHTCTRVCMQLPHVLAGVRVLTYTCAHSFICTHTAVYGHALVHLHSHTHTLTPSCAHSDTCRGTGPAHIQGDKRGTRPPGAPHPGATAAPQDPHPGPHSRPCTFDPATYGHVGRAWTRGPERSDRLAALRSLASRVPAAAPPGQPPRSQWESGSLGKQLLMMQGAGGDMQGSVGGVGTQADAPPWPGQGACPRRRGRRRRLDDGALLLLEEGAVGPGQQQLLLVGQAVQQGLLPAAAVHPHEGHDGEDQPGHPRAPEAQLRGERRAGSGPGWPTRPRVLRSGHPPTQPWEEGRHLLGEQQGHSGDKTGSSSGAGATFGSLPWPPPPPRPTRCRDCGDSALTPAGCPLGPWGGQWPGRPVPSQTRPLARLQGPLAPEGACCCCCQNKLTCG